MLKGWKLLQRTTARELASQYFFCTKPSTDSPNVHPSTQIQISEVAQKAMWATKIYRHIILALKEPIQKTMPLREQILKLQFPQWKMDEAIREESLKLFTSGIKIDTQVYGEDCFQQGSQVSSNKMGQNLGPNKQHQFIFCPNILVTSRIFNTIRQQTGNIIIYGGHGVNTTVQLTLLCLLNQPIHKFIHKQYQLKKQKNEKLSEMKKIQDYVQYTINRFWYWGIDWQEAKKDSFRLQQILLKQAHQLSEQEKDQLRKIENLNDFLVKLQKKYSYTTNRVIIHQVNNLASKMRMWNNIVDQHYALIKQLEHKKLYQTDQMKKKDIQKEIDNAKAQFTKKEQTQEKIITKILRIFKKFCTFTSPCARVILSSSISIQSQILLRRTNKDHPEKLFFEFQGKHGQSPLRDYNVQFSQNLQKQWGRKDFFDFFWFLIERRLKIKMIPINQIDTFRKKFYQKYQSFQTRNFYRFIYMNEILSSSSDLDNICAYLKGNTDDQQKIISANIESMLEKIHDKCFEGCRKKLIDFFTKPQDSKQLQLNKKVLLEYFYVIALDYKYSNREDQLLKFPMSILNNTFQQIYPIHQILLSDFHNKELIPVRYDNEKQMVILDWNAKDFLRLVKSDKIDFEFKNWASMFANQQLRQFFLKHTGPFGTFIQHLIMKIIRPQVEPNFIFSEFSQNTQQRKIYAARKFQHLNRNAFPFFEPNFKEMYAQAKNNPDKIYYGAPITVAGEEQVNSKAIDFAFLKYSLSNNLYYMNTVDVAITDQEKISDIMLNAFKLYEKGIQNMTKKQRKNHRFEHTLLCKKSSIKDYYVRKGYQKIKLYCHLKKAKKDQKKFEEDQLQLLKAELQTIQYNELIPRYMKNFEFSFVALEEIDFKTQDVLLQSVISAKAWIRMLFKLEKSRSNGQKQIY